MTSSGQQLPNFDRPPVAEVVLSAQFVPIEAMTSPHFGLLWQQFRSEFPITEQHAPVEHKVEAFGSLLPLRPAISLELVDSPPTPRCWFSREDGTQLIQVQTDRFMHNWKKVGEGDKYPRYERIRDSFSKELQLFEGFLQQENLGRFFPDQCEVTYVNHIFSGDGWENFGELGKIITMWSGNYSNQWLAPAESIKMENRHVITDSDGKPSGRLYIQLHSALTVKDRRPLYVLTLTGRTKPAASDLNGVIAGLDLAREWVVNGFVSITTNEMRKEAWGQT